MERPWIRENARERERIRKLAGALNDAELNLPLSAGWTIAVALAHLAFWDQRACNVLRKAAKEGAKPTLPMDYDPINDALVPLSLAIPPRAAANLALAAAQAIDSELENAPDSLITALETLKEPTRLNRALHRKLHLDEIGAVLKAKGFKQEI